MRVYPIFALALIASASVAQADSKSYCEIYAKDFASAKTSDVDQWQLMYRNSFTDCMDQYSAPTTAVVKPKLVEKVQKKKVVAIKAPEEKAPDPAAEKPVAKKVRVALERGSDQWNAYCADKYVSFNKETGTYKSRTGKDKPCLVTR